MKTIFKFLILTNIFVEKILESILLIRVKIIW